MVPSSAGRHSPRLLDLLVAFLEGRRRVVERVSNASVRWRRRLGLQPPSMRAWARVLRSSRVMPGAKNKQRTKAMGKKISQAYETISRCVGLMTLRSSNGALRRAIVTAATRWLRPSSRPPCNASHLAPLFPREMRHVGCIETSKTLPRSSEALSPPRGLDRKSKPLSANRSAIQHAG